MSRRASVVSTSLLRQASTARVGGGSWAQAAASQMSLLPPTGRMGFSTDAAAEPEADVGPERVKIGPPNKPSKNRNQHRRMWLKDLRMKASAQERTYQEQVSKTEKHKRLVEKWRKNSALWKGPAAAAGEAEVSATP